MKWKCPPQSESMITWTYYDKSTINTCYEKVSTGRH